MPAQKEKDASRPKKRATKGEAIIVNAGDSYAGILRKLKENISNDNILGDIKGVRKTANGNLLIDVNPRKTNNVKETLQRLAQSQAIRAVNDRDKQKVIHIKEIDSITQKDDVQAELIRRP